MAFTIADGPLLLLVVGPQELDTAEFVAFSEANTELSKTRGMPKVSLTFSAKAAMNLAQRKLLVDYQNTHGGQTAPYNAILSDSMLVRGAVTAYGWMAGATMLFKTFSCKDRQAALEWLRGYEATIDVQASMKVLRDDRSGGI